MNNGYFGGQFNADGFQDLERNSRVTGDDMLGVLGQDGMPTNDMMTSQSLDDLVNQSHKHAKRRSMPYSSTDAYGVQTGNRRTSMVEFGGGATSTELDHFQFNPTAEDMEAFMNSAVGMTTSNDTVNTVGGANQLALNTQIANTNFDTMGLAGSAYTSPMHPSTSMDMEITSPFFNTAMQLGMNPGDPSLGMVDHSPFYQTLPQTLNNSTVSSPAHQNYTSTPQVNLQSASERRISQTQSLDPHTTSQNTTPDLVTSASQSIVSGSRQSNNQSNPASIQKSVSIEADAQPHTSTSSHDINGSWQGPLPTGRFSSNLQGRPHISSQYKDAYSSTGFDMLNVLMRVATRPNPQINIGAVDLSCAFVVTDVEKDDSPIVYCSENFERLTGYTKHMILGRNCRFLQSPDGNVEPGVRRKYVDDDSVLHLKNTVIERKEAQISLINYRRGGQPFMNLLTIIPITMGGPNVKFFVGFQLDLVEQPNAVTDKNSDGSYTINYQRGLSMPRYIMHTPQSDAAQLDLGQTVTRDDVSTVLTTIGSGESELSKRIWDKVLLENTDDVVHVLSLKGLFLYLSPSSRKVLEYEASELIGTALSSVCHPSDIVPVTRELKDTSSGTSVNVVFRIRRKNSGYMWFESHGSLHTEHGKGRKCIILVGRERPVYTVSKSDLATVGGIGENELWTKMSTSGMFLFVSSNVRQLLDRQPEELVGTSIQTLMRQESKAEIGRMLSIVRTGKKASVQHEMMNKRGQVLKAFTTIYPGDAVEGQKPTFVVAQTRLIRFQRGGSGGMSRSSHPLTLAKEMSDSNMSMSSASGGGGNQTPLSSLSQPKATNNGLMSVSAAGQRGLLIGRQDASLASEENLFDELKTTRSTSWQYELRQMERQNRLLAEEVQHLLAAKKKRKRRKGAGQLQKDCANCHTRTTPEWRRGPSGNRDLCNSCGLRWAKQNGRISPRDSSQRSAASDKASKASASPLHNSITATELANNSSSATPYAPASQSQVQAHPQPAGLSHQPSSEQKQQPSGDTAARRDDANVTHISSLPAKIEEGVEPD